jgi:hypothetical protein
MSDLNKTENKFRWRPKSMCLRAEDIKPKPKSYRFKMKINKSPEDIDLVFKKYDSMIMDSNRMQKITEVNISLTQKQDNILTKKENNIDNINTLIQDCLTANIEIKDIIGYERYIRTELDTEQRAIADYCNDLKKKFSNIPKTVK